MKFKHSAFIRRNTPKLRKKLEDLGYGLLTHNDRANMTITSHELTMYGTLICKDIGEFMSAYPTVIDCGTLKKLNVSPFAQPYRDFENNIEPSILQKDFARYVNRKWIFKSTDWNNYKKAI